MIFGLEPSKHDVITLLLLNDFYFSVANKPQFERVDESSKDRKKKKKKTLQTKSTK